MLPRVSLTLVVVGGLVFIAKTTTKTLKYLKLSIDLWSEHTNCKSEDIKWI